jgi:glycosyltransferase involved in cell wall biosynthesis/CTP:molybdopterin cytidylyltransferase MocA
MVALAAERCAATTDRAAAMTPIDVVVRVFRGAEVTRRCLESVLASTSRAPFELVLVNDANAEPEIARHARELAARGLATLIEQPSTQGCAAALNNAFALHRDRDKVLLHADAEVAGDWLDRLAQHAGADGVGVVGTFTNAFGVATYPLPFTDNALPQGHTVATLAALFAHANSGRAEALPVIHGPCLYFRHECVASVGAFDGAPLGGDDGVDIDFCLRAGSAGFRHLVAGDVFVGCAGYGASTAREEHSARTKSALSKLYPAFPRQQDEIDKRDPARTFARRVDLLRLAELPKQVVVFVSHPWGGGIRRYMHDLASLIGDRAEVLYLEPAVDDTVKLYWPRRGESFSAYFRLPDEMPLLAEVLKTIGVARLHFHHVHRLPRAILELPSAVGVPFDCTLHDYFAICPQYHLVTEDGHYCGEPDAIGCAACLTRRPGQWGLDINAWRGAFGRFLRGADRLIAPSQDVAQRIRRYFPELSINVWPHPESAPEPAQRIGRVVILGNLSPGKGLHVVAACAEDAQARSLPLTFRVLGSTTEPVPQFPKTPLSIHGQYDDSGLAQLLAAEKPDVILFAAQIPETYAYTLSVALASGLPIVASALGALPERLAAHPHATTVPWNAPAAQWNAALLAAAGLSERPPVGGERGLGIPLRVAS